MGIDTSSKIQSFDEMAAQEAQAGDAAKEVVAEVTADNTSTDVKDEPVDNKPSEEGTKTE